MFICFGRCPIFSICSAAHNRRTHTMMFIIFFFSTLFYSSLLFFALITDALEVLFTKILFIHPDIIFYLYKLTVCSRPFMFYCYLMWMDSSICTCSSVLFTEKPCRPTSNKSRLKMSILLMHYNYECSINFRFHFFESYAGLQDMQKIHCNG